MQHMHLLSFIGIYHGVASDGLTSWLLRAFWWIQSSEGGVEVQLASASVELLDMITLLCDQQT